MFLIPLLTSCGYDLTGVNVYVSSEYGKTKRSGNLFREVLKALNPLRGVEVSASVLQRREELKKLESCESPEKLESCEGDERTAALIALKTEKN